MTFLEFSPQPSHSHLWAKPRRSSPRFLAFVQHPLSKKKDLSSPYSFFIFTSSLLFIQNIQNPSPSGGASSNQGAACSSDRVCAFFWLCKKPSASARSKLFCRWPSWTNDSLWMAATAGHRWLRVHGQGGGYFMDMKNSSWMGWNMVKLVQLKTWGGLPVVRKSPQTFKRLKLRKNTEDASNSGYKSSKRRLNAAICWTDTR